MSSPSFQPMVLLRSDLLTTFKQWCLAAGCNIVLRDKAYQVLDDSKAAAFAVAISKQVQTIMGFWKAERRDCDKFGGFAMSIAQLTHALHEGPEAGLAFGQMDYTPHGQTEGHCINILVTRVQGERKIRVRCFDPETGVEVGMTPDERASVELIFL